jgi:hypothetical protein
MLTEDVLTKKKLGCLDLVIITLSLDKAGIRYKINDDGSLSIYNTDFTLVESYDDHKIYGHIEDVYVEGHLNVENYHTKLVLRCNEYSTRIVPET